MLRPSSSSGFETYRFRLNRILERLTSGRRDCGAPRLKTVSVPQLPEADGEFALFCRTHLPEHRTDWTVFLARQVSEALDRLDKGTYGRCIQCGAAISTRRLDALPWVTLCVDCQERAAKNR